MKNSDAMSHVRAQSLFVDDLPEPRDLLHGAVFTSPIPRGRFTNLDTRGATAADGVVRVFTAADIPGENQIGGIIKDEPLLAEGNVHFIGQPIAVVVAQTRKQARAAVSLIQAQFEAIDAVFDPRIAASRGELIAPTRCVSQGDVDAAWADCQVVVEGTVESGAQEHVYLETQAAMAYPGEQGAIKLFSSTQAPAAVQRTVASVLGIRMNRVEVDVKRLGGAFGGKEDQATPWAAMVALAASILDRPVKIVLGRQEDIQLTGKRHPYTSDYKMGLDADGRILAYEATFYQNSGACADLSTAIMERSLFHAANSYFVPNLRIKGYCCRTNLPPFTAFRGFGAPQSMFVMESAMHKAAAAMGVEHAVLQEKNLLREGQKLHYGMEVRRCNAERSFDQVLKKVDYHTLVNDVKLFNENSRYEKRGVCVVPVCFGISFTSTFLNQASALVHVYTDGSVNVSTGAVEMGQGVNFKIRHIASSILGIPADGITVESTNTSRVANSSPTAASTGADMNGQAALVACQEIVDRLKKVAADELNGDIRDVSIGNGHVFLAGKKSRLDWEALVSLAYMSRVSLSAQAHYATPGLHYDKVAETGKPFAYHVFGAAVTEVTLDCLRGTYKVDRVSVVHDAGRSLNPLVDRGQIEGALVQGIGWLTMEELIYSEGRLLADSLATYKVPTIHSVPQIDVDFLDDSENPKAPLFSKAVGEPPFIYGLGAYLALVNAMGAFRPDAEIEYSAPLTPEKVLMFLHG